MRTISIDFGFTNHVGSLILDKFLHFFSVIEMVREKMKEKSQVLSALCILL